MNTYKLNIKKGGFSKPYGNNKADCILEIDTNYKDIGIKLKYEKEYDTYDVLGYMTIVNMNIDEK